MYLKHVRLHKRHPRVKNGKRRVTLSRFDAIFRCYALIIKMARLRFPGRPGQRIGKNYVKYIYDDLKLNTEISAPPYNKIEVGLKLFYELFGYSDEEDDFEGFLPEDIALSEAALAYKYKQKALLQRLVESCNEMSSPATSEIDRLFSSDSETSSSSIRRDRGMRDIARKSYDKMIKDGLKSNVHSTVVSSSKVVPFGKQRSTCNILPNEPSLKCNLSDKTESIDVFKVKNNAQKDCDFASDANISGKKSIVKHLLERAKHQAKTRRRRKKCMRPNVKKKFHSRFLYPTSSKYGALRKQLPIIKQANLKDNIEKKNVTAENFESLPDILNVEGTDSGKELIKRQSRRSLHKRFILPSVSARSSRKIIPRRRYVDEYDEPGKKTQDEDSQCSRSSLSGSSETISAMDGGSSPEEDTPLEDVRSKKLKKVGLLDRPLVVEGKRAWKPSLKVQMKLSEMNYEYPFALKKSGFDDSSGTGTSSGSFKDIIKPDMVSKYAAKMAQKPKDRPFKVLESIKRSSLHRVRQETERDVNSSDNTDDEKKPGNKLEKVAAKIEKLLKSQWEGRLKDPSSATTGKMDSVAQWRSEQQQRTSSQRRTKSIIRKARLQLKKKNLNLRTRKTDKNNSSPVESQNKKPAKIFSEKSNKSIADSNDEAGIAANSSFIDECDVDQNCAVCGFFKLYSPLEKLYDQPACEACSKFFDSFAKSPKQYFCTKDGNCLIDGVKDSSSRKSVNARCKACWLKHCMEKFTVSAFLRDQLIKYVPRLDTSPHNPLLIVDALDEPIGSVEEGTAIGPRIKHVCRRAAVVLGLPRARFSEPSLSALSREEKKKILETDEVSENIQPDSVPSTSEAKPQPCPSKSKQPLKKKVRKDSKLKTKVNSLKKSSLLVHKEQKRKKLLLKKSMKHLQKHSFKKSLKIGRKHELKKTLKFSYKSAVKTSLTATPKSVSKRPARTTKFRKVRCRQCEGCLAEDCGECAYCLDKKKFGGPNLIKQACMYRRCLWPVMPSPEKKSAKTEKGKPLLGHSSFMGDGPSLSLSSSSSSPTSPDNSSCGSSCSSSSSSSSSGSSGSSSSSSSSRSSTSSSSSSSSSSDNLRAPNSVLTDGCGSLSFAQSTASGPVVLQECTDNNVSTNPTFRVFDRSSLLDQSCEDSLESEMSTDTAAGGAIYREAGDTILYEDSSSIIELKNASFAPSLMYGASLGDSEGSTSYPTNTGSKNRTSGQESGNTRRTYCGRDQDQYGSAGSGGQESNGDEDEDEEDREKHCIFADYWEEYDPERISSQGFALISSTQLPLPCVCYLCGSSGEEKFIFCVLCCEPYHTFCLPDNDVPLEENLENWCCKRCQCCAVCGLKQNLLKCKICQCTYHAECLTPHYPTKPSKKKKIWMCPKCVKCKSCGTVTPSSSGSFLWNFDTLLCQPCTKLTDKGIDYF